MTNAIDRDRIVRAVREILVAIGEDPDREGLKNTPSRVASLYEEVFSGLHADPAAVLGDAYSERYNEIVMVRDIPFSSLCEHHLLPFVGQAHVAYIPNGHVLGLSKLARVVDVFAARPQMQERLTNQVADLIEQHLQPKGVAVIMEATHTCMTIRGVKKSGSITITSALRGTFLKDERTRNEVMALIRKKL